MTPWCLTISVHDLAWLLDQHERRCEHAFVKAYFQVICLGWCETEVGRGHKLPFRLSRNFNANKIVGFGSDMPDCSPPWNFKAATHRRCFVMVLWSQSRYRTSTLPSPCLTSLLKVQTRWRRWAVRRNAFMTGHCNRNRGIALTEVWAPRWKEYRWPAPRWPS